MATYNFTVRATDSAGAFSDRTFAIQVNNTLMDRFVVVGSTGLARSPNGEDGSWVYEPGLGGNAVVHGNGRWIVYNSANAVVHTSPDAVNWSTYTLAIEGLTFTGINRIKFINNQWVAFTRGATEVHCLISSDGINWSLAATIVPPPHPSYPYYEIGAADFEYSDGTYVVALAGRIYTGASAQFNRYLYSSTDLASWERRYSYSNGASPQLNRHGQMVRNINGMWLANLFLASTANAIQVSSDGVIWTGREMPANYCYGLTYYNGRLFTLSATTQHLYASEDAGRSWAQVGTGFSTISVSNVDGSVQISSAIGVYANRMIIAYNRGAVSTIYKSINDGSTWATETLDNTKIGNVNAVGVRV